MVWWSTAPITALGGWRQEDQKSKITHSWRHSELGANLNLVRSCFKNQNKYRYFLQNKKQITCVKPLGTKTITIVQKWIMKSRGCFYLVQSDFYMNRRSKTILEYDSHLLGFRWISPHFSLSQLEWNILRTALIFLTYFHRGSLVEAPDHVTEHFCEYFIKNTIHSPSCLLGHRTQVFIHIFTCHQMLPNST